jgi:hypothetical protein
VLIVYAEPGETLKGALVEVGVALACGNPVRWVGSVVSSTLTHHPLMSLHDSIEDALHALQR